ncbi:alpha-galactosidase [Alkalicoccus daliensis]|uniref:Alpha-galactosidase n=1 Tax=Alkalicoccus daliensis TaxID=745820 RepID=A0A1H0J657_9BACI|nr:alpha-galactosidase [Alkalicoccus daliensis]SDO39197.1 alpha-galactosidase [Alkalicoccus daliensis]
MNIFTLDNNRRFVLETRRTAYVFDRHDSGHMQHIYWGKKLSKADYEAIDAFVIPHSSFEDSRGVMGYDFIPWGELVYSEPTLKVSNTTGERGFDWKFQDYKISKSGKAERLSIQLTDQENRYLLELHYDVYPEYDMIGRSQTIRNHAGETLHLEAARSLQVSFTPSQTYQFSHLAGKWVGEFQLIQEEIREGRKTIDSRRGSTSHHANPWFAIDDGADEHHGNVWFGHFAYSGNWDLHVEKDAHGFVHVSGGLNDFDFFQSLDKNESFETPVFYIGCSDKGFTGMSQLSHTFQQEVILPEEHRHQTRKVLYNSWEATYFEVSAADQMALAEKAADIGCEMFVVDDGWFGERHSDEAGLGDWEVNKSKFPEGLDPLIKRVSELGMDFGIWVEPEMVNEDSQLFRQHPDWIYQFSGKTTTKARNQFVLNFGKKEVQEYIIKSLEQLMDNHNIKFFKWDMNRAVSEPGLTEMRNGKAVHTSSPASQKSLWQDHADGLYRVLDHLKKKYPSLLIETCSGGGGRIDLGVLQRTDQFWTSDNTDAVDRLPIQYGCSYAYNAKTMMCWVTDSPNWLNQRKVPLSYRFHSAMMGSLGIGGNLNHWPDEEKEEAAQWISLYKQIREVVQEGTQFRISSPDSVQAVTSMQYVSKDMESSVVFLLESGLKYGARPVRLKLKGLDPEAVYQLNNEKTASGAYFMNIGIDWFLEKQYQSEVLQLKKIK